MKILAVTVVASLSLSTTTVAAAQPPVRQACSVVVDITDTDPRGANVRATPGGAVIAALRIATEGWIEAHVTAQLGDWYEIDRAELNPAGSPARKVIFHGKGYLHKSLVGVSGLMGGMPIYSEPDGDSRPLEPQAQGDQPVDLLGCRGDFLELRTASGVGWTRRACTNTLTTCV
jgi:hypothetical protein